MRHSCAALTRAHLGDPPVMVSVMQSPRWTTLTSLTCLCLFSVVQVSEHVAAYLGLDPADVKQRNFPPTLKTSPHPGGAEAPSIAETDLENLKPDTAVADAAAENTSGATSSVTGGTSVTSDGDTGDTSARGDSSTLATKRPGCMGGGELPGDVASRDTAAAAAAGGGGVVEEKEHTGASRSELGASDEMYTLPRVWQQLRKGCGYDARRAAVAEFNKGSLWRKRGIAMTPVR